MIESSLLGNNPSLLPGEDTSTKGLTACQIDQGIYRAGLSDLFNRTAPSVCTRTRTIDLHTDMLYAPLSVLFASIRLPQLSLEHLDFCFLYILHANSVYECGNLSNFQGRAYSSDCESDLPQTWSLLHCPERESFKANILQRILSSDANRELRHALEEYMSRLLTRFREN